MPKGIRKKIKQDNSEVIKDQNYFERLEEGGEPMEDEPETIDVEDDVELD